MSVRKADRERKAYDKMKLITVSNSLVKRTVQILSREDTFPKRSRWLMGQKIADVAQDYHTQLNKANEINCSKVPELYKDRRRMQYLAYASLMTLDAKMSMAIDCFNINEDRFDAWADDLVDARNLLLAWIRADEKRYKPE